MSRINLKYFKKFTTQINNKKSLFVNLNLSVSGPNRWR
uniref:Uncharacterized protein n=1 Tax=Rhizophora mucronata TaxID=61149 RepID=A0A2P2NGY4_RHIMU